MKGAVVLLGLALAGPAMAETYDIPWFLAHPAERRETIRRCQVDVALAVTRICENAKRAGASELGEPLTLPAERDPWTRNWPAPAPQRTNPAKKPTSGT